MKSTLFSTHMTCLTTPVPERLRRMGLLTAGGKPDRDAMAVVSRLYAGAFYDDLYDFYSDMRSVKSAFAGIDRLADAEDAPATLYPSARHMTPYTVHCLRPYGGWRAIWR